ETVAQKTLRCFDFDVDGGSLLERIQFQQFVREDLAQLHSYRIVCSIQYLKDQLLKPLYLKRARSYEIVQGARLVVHERKDGKRLLERLVAAQELFYVTQIVEEFEDAGKDTQ